MGIYLTTKQNVDKKVKACGSSMSIKAKAKKPADFKVQGQAPRSSSECSKDLLRVLSKCKSTRDVVGETPGKLKAAEFYYLRLTKQPVESGLK